MSAAQPPLPGEQTPPAPPAVDAAPDPRSRPVPPPRFGAPSDSTVPLVLPGPPITVVLGPAPRRGSVPSQPEPESRPQPAVQPEAAPPPVPAPVTAAPPQPAPQALITDPPVPEDPAPAAMPAPAPTAEPAPAPAAAPAPVPRATAPAGPPRAPVVEIAHDDELDVTVVVPRGALLTDWNLVDRDGTAFRLHRSNVLGRHPSGAGAPSHAQLVLLSDPDRVLSRTHALLEVVEDELWVTDLHSTNGSEVLEPGQPPRRLVPGTRERVLLGSVLGLGGRRVSFAYGGHGPRA